MQSIKNGLTLETEPQQKCSDMNPSTKHLLKILSNFNFLLHVNNKFLIQNYKCNVSTF